VDLKEIGCDDVDWIHWLRIGTMMGSREHGSVLLDSIKGRKFLG
jgi:hypothetical protein